MAFSMRNDPNKTYYISKDQNYKKNMSNIQFLMKKQDKKVQPRKGKRNKKEPTFKIKYKGKKKLKREDKKRVDEEPETKWFLLSSLLG